MPPLPYIKFSSPTHLLALSGMSDIRIQMVASEQNSSEPSDITRKMPPLYGRWELQHSFFPAVMRL
ncbi:MAG: hypothetical protein K2Z81_08450, partial [Cyanobacteria bacterium]|nr:hypothetical protein [Cyanobacteriota bacterium]